MNDYESAAMWNIYMEQGKGVAIQSTYRDLRLAFAGVDKEIFIGVVSYLDYQRDSLPAKYLYEALLHKRRSFDYERELRVVCEALSNLNKKKPRRGVFIPVDLERLVRCVYVHPKANRSLYKSVVTETKAMLDVPIVKSKLYDIP